MDELYKVFLASLLKQYPSYTGFILVITSSAVTSIFFISTNSGISFLSSSSVKPAYPLKHSSEVTFNAILNPEVSESRDTDDTPVIKVFAMLFLVPALIAA